MTPKQVLACSPRAPKWHARGAEQFANHVRRVRRDQQMRSWLRQESLLVREGRRGGHEVWVTVGNGLREQTET